MQHEAILGTEEVCSTHGPGVRAPPAELAPRRSVGRELSPSTGSRCPHDRTAHVLDSLEPLWSRQPWSRVHPPPPTSPAAFHGTRQLRPAPAVLTSGLLGARARVG